MRGAVFLDRKTKMCLIRRLYIPAKKQNKKKAKKQNKKEIKHIVTFLIIIIIR